jgi:hypothetical protein
MQINRGGIDSSDMDMTDTSDSMKIVFSLDLYIGLIRTEELDELGQVMVRVLKNRYGAPGGRFVIGVDFAKSTLYDVEQSAQEGIVGVPDDQQIVGRTRTKRIDTSSFKF